MNRLRFFFAAALIAVALPNLLHATIDLKGRELLLNVTGVPTSAQPATGDCSWFFQAGPKATSGDVFYALYLRGISVDTAPRVALNGRGIDRIPVERDGGLLIRLPWYAFRDGTNELTLLNPGIPCGQISVQVFSLLDTFEEVHFDRAFKTPSALQKTQPAKHPSQNNYDAQHYDLAITVTMGTTNISSGALTMTGKVTSATLSQVALDFNDNSGAMSVTAVDSGPSTPALTYTFDTANDWIVITLPSTLSLNQTFTVRVFYNGTPATGGAFGPGYNSSTHSGVPIIYTFSEPYKARNWWPCKDLPDDKATMDMHITAAKTVSGDPLVVVSNGKLMSLDDLGATQRWNYSESYPLATYLVSICATNYDSASTTYTSQDTTKTMPITHYFYPEINEAAGLPGTLNAMNYLAQTFGEYPFVDEKYATATHVSNSGMEHQTNTSMPDGDVALSNGEGRRNIHELAHHWFGDHVTCNTFDHLWLNEGFATYCEALYYEDRDGQAAYDSYVAAWDSAGISNTVALVNTNADAFAQNVVYRKGAWVLHMLRHVVGDAVFFQSLRDYLVQYADGTAVTADFQAVVEAEYGQSLNTFFNQWCFTAGRPTYSWYWNVSSGPGGNQLNININQTQAGAGFFMPIDILVTDYNGNTQTYVIQNNAKTESIPINVGTTLVMDVAFDPGNYILKSVGSAGTTPRPVLKAIVGGTQASGQATITWVSGGGTTNGFEIIVSQDMTSWTTVASSDVLTAGVTSHIISGLLPGEAYYYRVRAFGTGNSPSAFSDTYGVRLSQNPAQKILIIDGYDRWDSQGRSINHPFGAWHGASVHAYGAGFDSCANEATTDASVTLSNYKALLWILGEESTGDETFSSAEQALVQTYLQAGGRLLATGAEIGWDLDRTSGPTAADRDFYNDYLKADYVADDSDDYTVSGTPAGIFNGMSFAYDDGTQSIYRAEFPDVLGTIGGSISSLEYSAGVIAGVQYAGTFPPGGATGKVVNIGFGFETIYPQATRDQVMARILTFFDITSESPSRVDSFMFF